MPLMLGSDTRREAYRAYELTAGRFWQVWGPRALRAYLGHILRGRRLRLPRRGDDLSQLGGDFIVGPRLASGQRPLWYARPSRHSADRPPASELLAAIDGHSARAGRDPSG